MNTVVFTFDKKCAEDLDVINHWVDCDEDTKHINVYVNDVEQDLIENLTDSQLCEYFGLESVHLISCNRTDYF